VFELHLGSREAIWICVQQPGGSSLSVEAVLEDAEKLRLRGHLSIANGMHVSAMPRKIRKAS